MNTRMTRRDVLTTGGMASAAALTAGCGFGTGGSGSSGSGGKTVTIWSVATGKEQKLEKRVAKTFNKKHESASAKPEFFQNDPYKNKLRTAMGSGNPPDLFHSWGGGVLKSYVDSDKVRPLPSSVETGNFFSSVMAPVTFDGKKYGVPRTGTEPVVFFYNKQIFKRYSLSTPTTWEDLLSLVDTLKSRGVVPLSLAGKNKWPGMMYLEYLVNRLGGTTPIKNVLKGKSGAWSDPAFLKANEMIQKLVSMKAFPKGFTSLDNDTNEDAQLVYSGKAAMQLMGTWGFGDFVSDASDFVKKGHLGWFGFPRVKHGKGDPKNVVGNPTTFYCISSASDARKQSATYLDDALTSDSKVDGLIDMGLAPPIDDIEDKLKDSTYPDWLLYIYRSVKRAPYFDLSWDQALPSKSAQELLTNVDNIFLKDISPTQFAKKMNSTIDN